MNDLRYAARMLAKNPGFTLVVAGLLASGFGANAVIFTAFDAILLRPLPVRHPEQLVRFVQKDRQTGTTSYFPYRLYESLRDHSSTLAAVFAENEFPIGVAGPEPLDSIRIRGVTPEFFDVLGVPAMLGRALTADDAIEHPGAPPAVLSYSFWQRRFHGDPNVIGKPITINDHPFVIAGVMPRDFNGISLDVSPDVRVPIHTDPMPAGIRRPPGHDWRDETSLDLSARLRPGVIREQAQAEALARFLAVMSQLPAGTSANIAKRGLLLDPLNRGVSLLRDRFTGTLELLIASVGLLLLMVCANVAGLLLARSASRREEIAVRLALGATPSRLIRQMLTESALLTALGAIGGVAVAFLATPLLLRSIPLMRDRATYRVALSVDLHPDLRVLLYTLAISALTVLLFGFAPALAASRATLDSVLRGARASSTSRGRQLLIVFQLTFCTVLLAGAGLLTRTFQQLRNVDAGFDREHIVGFTAYPWLVGHGLADHAANQEKSVRTALADRVRELPGVLGAAISGMPIMRGSGIKMTVAKVGDIAPQSEFLNTSMNSVTPDFFDTMAMPIVAGRAFTPADAAANPARVVVNESFARMLFPGENPIGKIFGSSWNGPAKADSQIIGVVRDAKYRSLREPMIPTVFNPWVDGRGQDINLYVRTRLRPESAIEPVRQILAQLDPALPFTEIDTMSEEVEASTAPERLAASLAAIFAALAALLAAVGIYGLLAYVVAQRRREIGIRMALGARPSDVAELIGRQALIMAAAGITLGLAAAMLTAPWVRSLLYGIAPFDRVSFASAAIFVLLVTLAAAAIPAMRATRIEPASALRENRD